MLPRDFSLGSITPLLKPDTNPTHAASYRPITLLHCLYRILARILATRFSHVMQRAIEANQMGFLPGRWIGDNVTFTSLLPCVMATHNVTGATIFVDIAKAYDTVDREFLFAVMACLGASTGMVNWARLLLSNTCASVQVNGQESAARRTHAGVRQGCPLAPYLYLFVAQALSSWLRAPPTLGVTVAGVRFVSTHLADDTQIHLSDLSTATLTNLTSTLAAFGAASGQTINPAKSKAVLMGRPPAGAPPTTLGPFPVVPGVVSLGVPQPLDTMPDPQPAPARLTRAAAFPRVAHEAPAAPTHVQTALAARCTGLLAALATVTRLPFSTFGRAFNASAYALSTLLYHAEFTRLPPQLPTLNPAVARAVAPHIPPSLLNGRPREGGFGLLPLREHILARHGALATRLLPHLLQELEACHWPSPGPHHGPTLVTHGPVPVRDLTAILNAPAATVRTQRHLAFIRAALAAPARQDLGPHLGAFRAALRAAWYTPCSNTVKAPLWCLALDALPGARFRPWRCACSAAPPVPSGRLHSHWECPVAQAVRAELTAGLPPHTLYTRAHVWLLDPPLPSCPPCCVAPGLYGRGGCHGSRPPAPLAPPRGRGSRRGRAGAGCLARPGRLHRGGLALLGCFV